MLKSRKIVLIYPGLTLAALRQAATLAVIFLNESLQILRAAANDTHLVVMLKSNSLVCCETEQLRKACTYQGIKPNVSKARLSMLQRMIQKWPEQCSPPSRKIALAQSCAQLMVGKISLADFVEQHPSQLPYLTQYQASLQLYKKMASDLKLLTKKRGHMIFSPQSSEKTATAVQSLLKDQPYYRKDSRTQNFDQYRGQSALLITDFHPGSLVTPLLKKIVDVVPARVNTDNGSALVSFETVVVTTQYSLSELTQQDVSLAEALKERFFFYTMKGDSIVKQT